jgi:hypothetical protein
MRDQLEKRLAELKQELEAGQKMGEELAAKQANLQATMLRIAGAVQVLEELLAAENGAPAEKGSVTKLAG